MKRVILFFVVVLTASTLFGQMSVDQKKESEQLMEVNRQWAKSVTSGKFLDFVSLDAYMLAPEKGITQGHEGIGGILAEFQTYPDFSITWEPHSAFVSESGDLGYCIDLILVSFNDEKDNKVELFEKGVSVWKKNANNEWKMAVDIWNDDKTIDSIKKK